MSEEIISLNNARVKAAIKLRNSASERKKENLFFLEGLRLCRDAKLSNISIISAFFTQEILNKHNKEVNEIIGAAKSVLSVTQDVMQKMSDTVSPQGIICICKIPKAENALNNGLYIGLENTQDPSNLGAIARSAEAFGAKGLIVSSLACDPFSPKSLRAGMGALFRLPVIVTDDFCSFIKEKQDGGVKLYASVVSESAKSITEVTPSGKSVLLIGNEANGLSEEIKAISDEKVTIRMYGRAESLNASAAAAVMIFELTKKS